MPDWPWPDTRLQRRSRIAHLYRDALLEHAPDACHELDSALDNYGQHWVTGHKPPINTDEPMTAKEIADWTDTKINNITNYVATYAIQPVGRRNGRKTYLLQDFHRVPCLPS